MATHTPGPWKIVGTERTYGGEAIGAEGGSWIAITCDFNRYDRDAEREANARLIAASPELLEAAQGTLEYWEFIENVAAFADIFGEGETLARAAVERLRAAVLKALQA